LTNKAGGMNWFPFEGGSASLFIAWWSARAPQDQNNVTKGQDALWEVVEEASGRGHPNPNPRGWAVPWWGLLAPHGGLCWSRCFGCLLEPS